MHLIDTSDLMAAYTSSLQALFPSLKALPRYEKVMLIDQNEVDLFIAHTLILDSMFATNVEVESNSQLAVERLKSANYRQLPDIIFLDIVVMNDEHYNFMLKFSELPEMVREKCKFIIMSEKYNKEERIMALMSPYVIGYLIKPLDSLHFREFTN